MDYDQNIITKAIQEYQCRGCVGGSNIECGSYKQSITGVGCETHCAGTIVSGIGKIFLGMPKGFNRIGFYEKMSLYIFYDQEQQNTQWQYDLLNISVWKYQNDKGHILIRGLMPRINETFLHIILKGNFISYPGRCVTKKDLESID